MTASSKHKINDIAKLMTLGIKLGFPNLILIL